jgi:hypothetical protein
MKFLVKIVIPGVILLALVAEAWQACPSQTEVFSNEGLLEATADQLKRSRVSAHLRAPIRPGTNVLWCGSFQLAWNEACSLVGENLHFRNEPEDVGYLNQKQFRKEDLDSASYVAIADFVSSGVHARIRKEVRRKFGEGAAPKHIPPPALTPRPQDIVAYAYLFKNLEFAPPFERLEEPLWFGDGYVACFGIGEKYKPGHDSLFPQVGILDYRDSDDFVIELHTKSKGDRVLLAKIRPGDTLAATIEAVRDRIDGCEPIEPRAGDVLKVPKLNFDVTRSFDELQGLDLTVSNPRIAKDLSILSAVQNVRFQMDEKGVRLRSESHIAFGCSATHEPTPTHVMIFDKPFLILLQRTDAKAPYFALWVDNLELLVAAN